MNKRIVIAFSLLICLALIIGGFLCWKFMTSWWSAPELESCIERLEDDGYIIEERSLTEFHVERVLEVHWLSDFRGIARQENVSYVFIDREIEALYFLSETPGGETEANVLHYRKIKCCMHANFCVDFKSITSKIAKVIAEPKELFRILKETSLSRFSCYTCDVGCF